MNPSIIGKTGTRPDTDIFRSVAPPMHDFAGKNYSREISPDPKDDATGANGKRTKVACDTCRRKKIKCSGEIPCSNCIQSKEPHCIYKEKPSQKKVHKGDRKISGIRAIQSMESRLSLLENTLLNISDKLNTMAPGYNGNGAGPTRSEGTYLLTKQETNETEDLSSDYSSSDDEMDGDDNVSDSKTDSGVYHSAKEPNTTPLSTTSTQPKLSSKEKKLQDSHLSREFTNFGGSEKFFGSHSVLSVCSDRSIEWIGKSLPASKRPVLDAFSKVPYLMFQRSKDFFKKWVDPAPITEENKVQVLERPLPDNKDLIFDLLDNHYAEACGVCMVCDEPSLRRLFSSYFGLIPDTKRPTSSQLLIMCMGTFRAICVKLNLMAIDMLQGKNAEPTYHSLNFEQLLNIQDGLMTSAILLFQKVCVFGHGIETIQGILMLLDAIEASQMTFNVDFMLISVAVRFAQDMGLHRPELYSTLPREQIELRKRIWCLCYAYDVEYCFQTGKPPVINSNDVYDFTVDLDFLSGSKYLSEKPLHEFYDPQNKLHIFGGQELARMKEYGGKDSLFLYYVLLMSKIRFKSYTKLFSASAHFQTVECILEVIEELNNDTWKASNIMMDEYHPYFHDEPEFFKQIENLDATPRIMVLALHMTFFFHLMVTNRVPFMTSDTLDNNQVSRYRKIYLRSARTILMMSSKIGYRNTHISNLNWISFYPFAAFLVLMSNCINNPHHPDCKSDLKILVGVSDYKLGLESLEVRKPISTYMTKSVVTLILLKLFLIITIEVVSFKTNEDIYPSFWKKGFADIKKVAPELFKIKKSLLPMFENAFRIKTPYDSVEGSQAHHSPATSDQSLNTNNNLTPHSSSFEGANVNGYADHYQSQSRSPSFNPALANIMDPVKDQRSPTQTQFTPELLNGSFSDYYGDEALESLVNSQMVALPNFFFDNNLGFQ